jgi:hypothetical protein
VRQLPLSHKVQCCALSDQDPRGLLRGQYHVLNDFELPPRGWTILPHRIARVYLRRDYQPTDTLSTTKRQERPARDRLPQLSTIMSTPSVAVAIGERQSDCKITVESLCCDSVQAKSTSSEPTGQRHLHESETRSSPDMVPIWPQDHYHPKRLDAIVDRPCSLVAHSSGFHAYGFATQLSRVSRPDIINIPAKTPHHLDNNGGVAVSLPPTLFTTSGSSKADYKYQGPDPRVQSMDQPTTSRSPRQAPRPSRLP